MKFTKGDNYDNWSLTMITNGIMVMTTNSSIHLSNQQHYVYTKLFFQTYEIHNHTRYHDTIYSDYLSHLDVVSHVCVGVDIKCRDARIDASIKIHKYINVWVMYARADTHTHFTVTVNHVETHSIALGSAVVW